MRDRSRGFRAGSLSFWTPGTGDGYQHLGCRTSGSAIARSFADAANSVPKIDVAFFDCDFKTGCLQDKTVRYKG